MTVDAGRQDLLELRQILYWRWDPIGVSDAFPMNAGEYDTYARHLLERLENGAGEDEVSDYLANAEQWDIEVGVAPEVRADVVARVVGWFAARGSEHNEARRLAS